MPSASPLRERRVARLDLQTPRQVGREAEQLVVEPVADASDGLRDEESGREGVGERPEPQARDPAADEHADCAADERAEDGVAALPDREDLPPLLAGEVVGGVREHVVEPRADDAERHRPQDDVEHDPGSAPRLVSRRDVMMVARMMPSRMASAYMWMLSCQPKRLSSHTCHE